MRRSLRVYVWGVIAAGVGCQIGLVAVAPARLSAGRLAVALLLWPNAARVIRSQVLTSHLRCRSFNSLIRTMSVVGEVPCVSQPRW